MKYPDIFCGSSDHGNMAVVGIGVLLVAILFVVYYVWAVAIAPRLAGREAIAMLRFALQRFRPDMWWYGLLVLIRGLLLSFPAVVASNVPNFVVVLMFAVQLVYVLTVAWFTPWKARILNLLDCVTGGLYVLLLALTLEIVEAEADTTNPFRSGAIFAMVGLTSLVLLSLVISILMQLIFGEVVPCLGGKQTQEESGTIVISLREIAKSLESRTDEEIAKVPCLTSSPLVSFGVSYQCFFRCSETEMLCLPVDRSLQASQTTTSAMSPRPSAFSQMRGSSALLDQATAAFAVGELPAG